MRLPTLLGPGRVSDAPLPVFPSDFLAVARLSRWKSLNPTALVPPFTQYNQTLGSTSFILSSGRGPVVGHSIAHVRILRRVIARWPARVAFLFALCSSLCLALSSLIPSFPHPPATPFDQSVSESISIHHIGGVSFYIHTLSREPPITYLSIPSLTVRPWLHSVCVSGNQNTPFPNLESLPGKQDGETAAVHTPRSAQASPWWYLRTLFIR